MVFSQCFPCGYSCICLAPHPGNRDRCPLHVCPAMRDDMSPHPAPPNPFTPTPFCPSVNACSVWQTSPRHLHPLAPTSPHQWPPQTPLSRRSVRFCIAINVIMVSNCIQKYPSSTPPSGTSSKSFGDPIRWCLVAWPPAICV